MRKIQITVLSAWLTLFVVYSVASSNTLSLRFRPGDRGLALEQRGGVPLSGVVLFEPAFLPGERRPLDEVGPNVRCNQDPIGNNQNETTIAASPANPLNMLSGSNDYRNGDASGGFYRSTDGGATWADALVTRGPAGTFDAAGDPVAVIGPDGRMYAAYIAFDRNSDDNGIYVQTSTNNGTSWSAPSAVIQHTGGGTSDFEDKPYACADFSSGSPYYGNYYITWTKFPVSGSTHIWFSKSTNGGATFSAPVQISGSGGVQFSCPTVGPNGEIYVVWYNTSTGQIKFDKSTNGGTTWGTDVNVSTFNNSFPTNPCGTFRTPSYPVIGCDISNGPRRGWIYVCWADGRNGNPDIFFSRSTDGGATWSAAARVDNDNTGRWQWWQWLAVNPANGDVGVSWLDRREDPAGCQYKAYATISTNGGASWAANFPVASVASNPSSSSFLGDYTGTTFRSLGFHADWVDLRNDGGDVYAGWFNLTPTITVTAPNGGETWFVGESNNITWTSANLTENVKIELNRTYPGGVWETIIASTPNDGTHPWTVTGTTSTTSRIRITGTVQTTVGDTSNANFTIAARSLVLTAPNGGELWNENETRSITWTSQNAGATVLIELNRNYPAGNWEIISGSAPNTGSYPWTVTLPATVLARVRVSSVSFPALTDVSDNNFSIQRLNQPPSLWHDPLHDQEPAPVVVTAIVVDDLPGFAVKFFYRPTGGGAFDSLAMTPTGNPDEFAAVVGPLAVGDYEYFLRARDSEGAVTATSVREFSVGSSCGIETGYDDGSAEASQWSENTGYRWAVKFSPPTPYVLCSGRIGISALHPDEAHSSLFIEVLRADGAGGLPGTVVLSHTAGSIGNVIGGVPVNQDNWTTVIFRDAFDQPLVLSGDFYVAVSNPAVGSYEAFLHDTSSVRQGRSYVFDPCDSTWIEERTMHESARPGNRMIRVNGFSLIPPTIVISPANADIRLDWDNLGAPYYHVFSAVVSGGPFTTFEGTATTNSFVDVGGAGSPIKFYVVYSSRAP